VEERVERFVLVGGCYEVREGGRRKMASEDGKEGWWREF
jgi:hypothetical protein